ncbi:hypothetical protein PENTCL1PPCAC_16866 [Pristionchus entomophagus]|uniref:Uncharacterized protein n=1 Tax=Pristionchus entomophagus TaxID=358040 RepID=A0AAV5TK79_9BILA|nr:hypothetical protein PENTCL1PPCAC_16866 [Pristionchus entomophagus]
MIICTGDVNESATIVLRESFAKKYNLTINDGWRDDTFQLRPFFVVLSNDIIMLFTLTTQIALATMTFYYIHINTWVSDYYRKSQQTVLIALHLFHCCSFTSRI